MLSLPIRDAGGGSWFASYLSIPYEFLSLWGGPATNGSGFSPGYRFGWRPSRLERQLHGGKRSSTPFSATPQSGLSALADISSGQLPDMREQPNDCSAAGGAVSAVLPWLSCSWSLRSSAFSSRCCCRRLQSAQEAARRTRCANNLKQLGVALLAYHNAKGSLPIGYWAKSDTVTAEWPDWPRGRKSRKYAAFHSAVHRTAGDVRRPLRRGGQVSRL